MSHWSPFGEARTSLVLRATDLANPDSHTDVEEDIEVHRTGVGAPC